MSDYRQTAARALALCAAHDPWFPQANRATVEAWADQIAEYRLDERDVLQGVRVAYRDNGSGFRPLPADIVQKARQVRRDRTERETDAERRAREDRRDAELDRRALAQITSRAGSPALGKGLADA